MRQRRDNAYKDLVAVGGHNPWQGVLEGHRQIAMSVRQVSDRHTEIQTVRSMCVAISKQSCVRNDTRQGFQPSPDHVASDI